MDTLANEEHRLAALEKYGILDSEPEPSFDRVTRLAAALFEAPISIISLVDRDRQWFKSAVGLSARETPREVSFCSHAIGGIGVFIVPDTLTDDRFATNALVTGDPGIRFYAGAPLVDNDGNALGTICVIDKVARPTLSPQRMTILQDFAGVVMDLIVARRNAKRLEAAIARGYSFGRD